MMKQYAVDLAKKLYREHDRSYFVVQEEGSDSYRVVDKEEKEAKQLNRYVVFSIETD
ncbi:hypothetical protein [Cohnella sp. JJ-181]|uniref:hypothetical protein n=1 Tax=Cohnella rhizoplanae TaxID=2974897 RepID=UPI0022FF6DF6|nr:hypothetical protein [Cohnella sp. JJ-181]CAI6021361.1 hypothetical protein COHCIP112018_00324 [Cohnella sp. JJ-181]